MYLKSNNLVSLLTLGPEDLLYTYWACFASGCTPKYQFFYIASTSSVVMHFLDLGHPTDAERRWKKVQRQLGFKPTISLSHGFTRRVLYHCALTNFCWVAARHRGRIRASRSAGPGSNASYPQVFVMILWEQWLRCCLRQSMAKSNQLLESSERQWSSSNGP